MADGDRFEVFSSSVTLFRRNPNVLRGYLERLFSRLGAHTQRMHDGTLSVIAVRG